MPIYAYKCTACGHAQDVLQKISDKPLTECPACKQSTYAKQVTAAGFQLKGSGWYVTDFRNNAGGTSKTSEAAVGKTAAETSADAGQSGAGASGTSGASSSDSSQSGASGATSASTAAPASSGPSAGSSTSSPAATSSAS
ncbi:zinc ribbon domain-containing protein [Orrella sp. NBD-18]|uniref:Zinc ribbon domain-containing protein n=1 Tax=Sheuella amnicola TaxID=2707330 RepID=A0A6B2QZ28_9BURK|nr:FmdB family zinc ribbon protein [Sheuella amnicola]NDY82544.1 zinc ribbon domain-containing protein [Sheuella amnicola]